jgi:hypothetical protein
MVSLRGWPRGHLRRVVIRSGGALLVAWSLGAAVVVLGQELSDPRRLREAILERYDVVPLSNGVGLVSKRGGPRIIEVTGDTIAIDGLVASGAEVRAKLGSDADLVLRLSYLDPAERRRLFGFDQGPPRIEPPAAPSPPVAPRGRPRGRRIGDRVRIFGNVEVRADEEVSGDVVAVLGSARVEGHVGGDVVAVLGWVHLGPQAWVEGDVTSVAGRVDRAPGARVDGSINEVAFAPRLEWRPWWSGWLPWAFGAWDSVARVGRLMGTLVRFLLLLLLGALVVLVARDPVERAATRARTEPLKAGFVGLLAELLVLPVLVVTVVVLIVSIIGIPLLLLVPFGLVALLLLLLFGFTAAASGLGRLVAERVGWDTPRPYAEFAAGLTLIFAPLLVARAVGLAGWPLTPFAAALATVGWVVEYAAWTAGFGAALLGLFRRPAAHLAGPPPTGPAAWPASSAAPPADAP